MGSNQFGAGRDITLDALKMAFAIMIVCRHLFLFNMMPNGEIANIGVDFFFIVSGFMLLSSMKKDETSGFSDFLKHKIKIFFPFMLVSVLIDIVLFFAVNVSINNYGIVESLYQSVIDLFHAFLLGGEFTFVSSVWWYLSVMIISIVILYPLIRKYKEEFTTIFAPLIGFVLLGIICENAETFGDHKWFVIVKEDLVRGLGEMCLGVFAYECAMKVNAIRFNTLGKGIVTITTLLMFAYVFVGTFFFKDIDSGLSTVVYEFIIVMAMLIGIILLMSRTTPLNIYADSKFKKKVSVFLGTGSLLIYMNHYGIVQTVQLIFPDYGNEVLIAFCFAVAIVFTLICYIIGKNLDKITGLFVIRESD